MSVGSEIADLLIFLTMTCVPLAVGVIAIPIGRALAERIRGDQALRDSQALVLHTLQQIEGRIATLEVVASKHAAAVEALAARRLPELPPQSPTVTPRPITPH